MKKLVKIVYALIIVLSIQTAKGQNFKADLKKLEAEIEAAYKAKKLTAVEYGKMKQEQDIIQLAIDKANADDIMTPAEKNKIHSKIIRSKKRLVKYQNNREIY